MISKVYAYLGKNQASIDIPTGSKGYVKVEFTGGNVNDRFNYSMAKTKPITNPAVQAVIENSPFFGNKIILVSETDSKAIEEARKVKEHPEITNFAEAVALLKSEYQVKAAQLRSAATVRAQANALNIAFPNWV